MVKPRNFYYLKTLSGTGLAFLFHLSYLLLIPRYKYIIPKTEQNNQTMQFSNVNVKNNHERGGSGNYDGHDDDTIVQVVQVA